MKHGFAITMLYGALVFSGCSLQDNQAGVTITGNTGKIVGHVLTDNPATLAKMAVSTEVGVGEVTVVLTSNANGFEPETTWTDELGRFAFDNLPQGSYDIVASDTIGMKSTLKDIEIQGLDLIEVTVYLGVGTLPENRWRRISVGAVFGTVEDATSYTVFLISEDSNLVYETTIDSTRQYRADAILLGWYRVLSYGNDQTSFVRRVQVKAGEALELNLQADNTYATDETQIATLARSLERRYIYPNTITKISDSIATCLKSQTGFYRYDLIQSIEWLQYPDSMANIQNSSFTMNEIWLVDSSGFGIVIAGKMIRSASKIQVQRMDSLGIAIQSADKSKDTYWKKGTLPADTATTGVPRLYEGYAITITLADTTLQISRSAVVPWNQMECKGYVNFLGQYSYWMHVPGGVGASGFSWWLETNEADGVRVVNYPDIGDTMAAEFVQDTLHHLGIIGSPDGRLQDSLFYQGNEAKIRAVLDIPWEINRRIIVD